MKKKSECRAFCARPGWWSVEEAVLALEAGYGSRMMFEMAPNLIFGVLAPAFRGCERDFALQQFSRFGCNFFTNGMCELYPTGMMPLECRFCHHSRIGLGKQYHNEIEKEWKLKGKDFVLKWAKMYGLADRYGKE